MLTSLVDAVLFMLTKCSVFPALFVFYLFSFVVRVCAHSVQTLGKIKLEIEQPVHYILSLSLRTHNVQGGARGVYQVPCSHVHVPSRAASAEEQSWRMASVGENTTLAIHVNLSNKSGSVATALVAHPDCFILK